MHKMEEKKKRIRLRVAYDGTAYHGWQIQKNAVSVAGVLQEALQQLLQEEIELIGASRTDAGVHARGNVAIFDTNTRIPPEKIAYALNQRLPEDIVVQKSEEVAADFHPRYAKSWKTYEYRIFHSTFPDPILRKYMHFYYGKLNVAAMQKAAGYVIGEHDFASFCSAGAQVSSTVRTVSELTVEKEKNVITIRITGNGFLYNMVRIIAGTLLEIGSGKRPPEEMKRVIQGANRSLAGATAPAQGLHLIEIVYENE